MPRPSALVVIVPSPEAADWRCRIEARALIAGIHIASGEQPENAAGGPVLRLSDDLRDLEGAYDEKTVVLTQAETLGLWTGLSRADASLALASLPPASDNVRYITPSSLAGRQTAEILSFLTVEIDGAASAHAVAKQDQALRVYREGPPRPGESHAWSPGEFLIDPKHEITDSGDVQIDLVGRARCLVHGPYVVLPQGHWKASVRFFVDKPASDHRLRLEWGASDSFSTFEVSPGEAGYYLADIAHTLPNASLVELRLILPESSLAGHLTFQGVDLKLSENVAD